MQRRQFDKPYILLLRVTTLGVGLEPVEGLHSLPGGILRCWVLLTMSTWLIFAPLWFYCVLGVLKWLASSPTAQEERAEPWTQALWLPSPEFLSLHRAIWKVPMGSECIRVQIGCCLPGNSPCYLIPAGFLETCSLFLKHFFGQALSVLVNFLNSYPELHQGPKCRDICIELGKQILAVTKSPIKQSNGNIKRQLLTFFAPVVTCLVPFVGQRGRRDC